MLLGFDVGGTNARAILLDESTGEILGRVHRRSDGSGPVLVAKLAEMADELRRAAETSPTSIGLGIAGLAHASGTVRYSPNLPELIEYPIGPELESSVGLPVTIVNDATAGAWAESTLGAGRGVADLLFVALGTGIGTGFTVGGRIVTGANGFAGEAGHMVVDFDGPPHHTGQRGPWEYFGSGNALGRMAREAARTGSFDLGIARAGTVDAITGLHVADGCAHDDAAALAILDSFCREVSRGIANLVLVLDSERVVIGGGLTGIGAPLRDGIDRWLRELLPGQHRRPTVPVDLATLGADAGAIGAALLSTRQSDSG